MDLFKIHILKKIESSKLHYLSHGSGMADLISMYKKTFKQCM